MLKCPGWFREGKGYSGMKIILTILTCLSILNGQDILLGAPLKIDHIPVELVTDTIQAEAGRPFSIGLRIKMDEGWHTYWENPGDSGLATNIDWELPEGFTAAPIQWPFPQ